MSTTLSTTLTALISAYNKADDNAACGNYDEDSLIVLNQALAAVRAQAAKEGLTTPRPYPLDVEGNEDHQEGELDSILGRSHTDRDYSHGGNRL